MVKTRTGAAGSNSCSRVGRCLAGKTNFKEVRERERED